MSGIMKQKFMVIFQPSGRRGHIENGRTIKQASQELGVDIEDVCGEMGTCGKCKVRIETGVFDKYGVESRMENLSEMNEAEKTLLAMAFKRQEYDADNFMRGGKGPFSLRYAVYRAIDLARMQGHIETFDQDLGVDRAIRRARMQCSDRKDDPFIDDDPISSALLFIIENLLGRKLD